MAQVSTNPIYRRDPNVYNPDPYNRDPYSDAPLDFRQPQNQFASAQSNSDDGMDNANNDPGDSNNPEANRDANTNTTPATTPTGNAKQRGVSAQQYFWDAVKNFGWTAKQSDPTSLQKVVDALRAEGWTSVTLDSRPNDNLHKGIYLDGTANSFVKLLDGYDNWIWDDMSGTTGTNTGTTTSTYVPKEVDRTKEEDDEITKATQAAILKQLQALQDPTDPNSATVTAITDPYHLQSQRGLEATRRALAEQAYASGNLNTGGYAGSQISAVEKAGAEEAGFVGQTVATQEAQRKQQLMSLLGLGTDVSKFNKQLSATQKNFADQLAQQDRQFAANLAAMISQYGQTLGYQYALLEWAKQQHAIDHAG